MVDRAVLLASYLPAGTYQFAYTPRATGQEFYTPEVYGRSDGVLFVLLPEGGDKATAKS